MTTLRTVLLLAFRSLPILLISFIGFLAFGLGNTSLFYLLSGNMFIVPLLTYGFHLATATSPSIAMLRPNDVAQLIAASPTTGKPYGTPVNVFPSYWMAQMSFIFGYIISNATFMYMKPVDTSIMQGARSTEAMKQLNDKVAARQGAALIFLLSNILFFLVIAAIRIFATDSETMPGFLLAVLLFGTLGGLWYWFAQTFLGATNSDIFGIAMQMMSPTSAQNKPVTCVYKANP